MAFNYATKKQQDKKLDKTAKIAQGWLQKGFSPKQVAEGIWNKFGYQSDVKDEIVRIWGFYNSEYKKTDPYIRREITSSEIRTPQN